MRDYEKNWGDEQGAITPPGPPIELPLFSYKAAYMVAREKRRVRS